MRTRLALSALLIIPALGVVAAPSPKEAARDSAKRGLTFLTAQGDTWKYARKCASCHHGPFMLWGLNEAKRYGYAVDEKLLTAQTEWVSSPDNIAQVVAKITPPPKPEEPKLIHFSTLMVTLGLQAADPIPGSAKEAVARYQAILRDDQRPDGSWGLKPGGRPPLVADPELMTLWTVLALTAPGYEDEASKSAVDKALAWLAANPPSDDLQTTAFRLLLARRQNRPKDELKAIARDLLARQKPDGSWSQTKDLASDAYATGVVLYILTETDAGAPKDALKKAQAWLVNAQHPDGTWPMKSRIVGTTPPAHDVGPITYVGTGWATLALVRSAPLKEPKR